MSTISPESKRNKIESPIIHHQNSLALPGTSWKPNSLNNNSSHLQMNSKLNHSSNLNQHQHPHHQTELPTPADDRPMASGSGTATAAATTTNQSTDFDSINDAVGISGVDIAAEEELARQQTSMYGRGINRLNSTHSHSHSSIHSVQPLWNSTNRDRVKITDFLNKGQLTSMVQQIAASYQLKTLEPAILDVLTQAAEQRLHSIIIDSISAKDHRIASSHLRPPPLYPTPSNLPPPKGKQKEKAREAMYDQVIYDEPERILSILARVEGEEERKSRLERESDPSYEGFKTQQEATPPMISNEPLPPDITDEKAQQKKEKKRKREGPGQQARNMSEDARARQSNQTAMRSVGGRSKYSWLSGGVQAVVQPPGSETKGIKASLNFTPTSILASLPAPKFAPQSNLQTSLSNPNMNSIQTDSDTNMMTNSIQKDHHNLLNTTSTTTTITGQGNRLGGLIPGSHSAVKETGTVNLKDSLFALERERGTGAGRGSGSRVLFKSYLNSSNSNSNELK